MAGYVISIDPSINNVGCAVFAILGKKKAALVHHVLIHPSKFAKSENYLAKSRDICQQIVSLINNYDNVQLVTEIPQHFGTGGYLARESGSVQKLTFVAGMIFNIADDVVAYEPNQWKGQLPKDVVARRLQRIYKDLQIFDEKKKKFLMDHNIVDAIGIGHRHIYGKIS